MKKDFLLGPNLNMLNVSELTQSCSQQVYGVIDEGCIYKAKSSL
jgi:hypothetical protein